MTFEDTHAAAVRNGRVIIPIIFKDHIVEETLEVKGLLGAYYIKDCIFLDKRECLARNRSTEHTDCVSSLAVFYGLLGVA